MEPFTHYVQYYETDKMGITHHSNYIRFMEEARVAFLTAIGWDYQQMEQRGLISPVVSVQCKYLKPSTFADTLTIAVTVKKVSKVKLTLAYRITNQHQTICKGLSEHCFTTKDGQILKLDQDLPDFYQALTKLAD